MFSQKPAHTWASDPCDAVRVYATALDLPDDYAAPNSRLTPAERAALIRRG